MYDTFEALKQLQHQSFDFQTSRYEIWKGGQMIKSGKTTDIISARVTQSPVDKGECSIVTMGDLDLNSEIARENYFDIFITGNDRLQLVTIPEGGNENECVGIVMFKNVIGSTRQNKSFNQNEPYCCNLFLQNGALAKVTFSFNSPEKLIEFYP